MPETPSQADANQITLLTDQLAEMSRKYDAVLAAKAAETAAAAAPPESDNIKALRALIDDLAKKIDATAAAPPPGPNGAPPFIAPITTTTNGASPPSLRSLFPDIEAAHITAIITHEFCGTDLYKLDSRYRDKEASFAFNGTTGQFETSNRAAKDYKTFNALYLPLVVYFSVLAVHVSPQRTIPLVFFQFLTHLQKIADEYEWSAVLEYTMVFFNRRRMEMLENGDYSKWATPDAALMAEHIFAHKKVLLKSAKTSGSTGGTTARTTPTVCLNWNAGKCSGTAKCPGNRSHVCSSCGKSDHTVLEHPKST